MEKEEQRSICGNCGKCCLSYWIFTDVPEEVERFKTLNTNRIEVIQIKEKLWKVMFHFECKHLEYGNWLYGNYRCKIYDKPRPKYCPDYPRNFLDNSQKEALDNEIKFCPLLKKLQEVKPNSSHS